MSYIQEYKHGKKQLYPQNSQI